MPRSSAAQSVLRYPLTAALAGEGGVRLLRELARHGGPLSPRVLADRGGLTIQGARRALKRLVALGLANTVGSGNRLLYHLNPAHPLAPALAALFAAEAARVEAVFGAVRAAVAAAALPVLAAWLYGSAARGDDAAASDLDVAVVFDADRDTEAVVEPALDVLREALAPVERAQLVTLSLVGLSRDDVRRLSTGDPWWANIVREAVPLIGPAPSALTARLAAASRRGTSPAAGARGQVTRAARPEAAVPRAAARKRA